MTSLVSIDPGVRALGVCVWQDGELWLAHLSRTKARKLSEQIEYHRTNCELAIRLDGAAVESMAYRPTDSTPQDLINVQSVGCALGASMARKLRLYPASEWKGSIEKRIHHARIVEGLMPTERAILDLALRKCPKAHHKEILDALGIGLYHLKRTSKSGGARR